MFHHESYFGAKKSRSRGTKTSLYWSSEGNTAACFVWKLRLDSPLQCPATQVTPATPDFPGVTSRRPMLLPTAVICVLGHGTLVSAGFIATTIACNDVTLYVTSNARTLTVSIVLSLEWAKLYTLHFLCRLLLTTISARKIEYPWRGVFTVTWPL